MRGKEYKFINFIRKNIVPDAHKKHYGSYLSFDDKPLSKGCQACKNGGWLCVFIGTKCNCSCPHCPNPNVNNDYDKSTASGFGDVELLDILKILEDKNFSGIAISGGEPLLYIDKLVEWVTSIRAKFPNLYIWCYTNGIFANEDNLKRLKYAGLNEIRFDLAATNYSKKVLQNMELATKIIPSVGIEVPVLAEQFSNLIDAITFGDKVGVKYINLHDLYINNKIYKNGFGGYIPTIDKFSSIQRDIYNSEVLIYRAFRHIKDNNLNIIPNDCILINMQLQHIGLSYINDFHNKQTESTFKEYIEELLPKIDKKSLLLERELN